MKELTDDKINIPYKKAPYWRWKIAGIPKHVTKKHKLLMYVTTAAVFAYVFWRVVFTLPLQYGAVSIVLGLLLLFAELSSFTITLSNFREATHYIDPALPDIPEEWYPEVDVYIATHNESVALMYKTINACTFLEYTDKSKVHVWLCDDRNRPEMRELAKQFGIGYCGMENNKHAKAGNLNNALRQTSAPLVVTFDADMIPSSDFLLQTVPFFFLPYVKREENGSWRILEKDEIDPEYKIGFVQSPQSFYNPDLYQYNLYSEQNIPNEQDYFFTQVNVAKNHDNVAQYAGSNTVLSRQALEDVGGFNSASITEDFLTGLMILQAGYRNLGIPKQLAHGLSPDTIGSLMAQRERWARGNIQVFKILRVWTTHTLNFWQKFSLTASLCYWFSFLGRLIFLLAPIMSALFDIRIVNAPVWQTLLFWLPHYILYYYATKIFSDNTKSNHWSAVVDTIMAPYLSLPAIWESLGFKQKKFVVTNKDKGGDVEIWRTFLYVLPHTLLLITTFIAILLLIRHSLIINSLYNPIVLFWLFIGSKNLLFAIFFMLGRINIRNAERIFARLDVFAECNDIQSKGHTTDLSDTGLGAVFDVSLNCKAASIIKLTVKTELYCANMQCKVVNVKKQSEKEGGKWKYGFVIETIDDENMRQFMQILYDRPHSLPKRFKPNSSVFDDINTNLMLRTRRRQYNLRKLPRLNLELPFRLDDGTKGVLHDFNFDYVRLELNKYLQPDMVVNLNFGEGLRLVLIPHIVDDETSFLYKVVNSDEILERPDYVDVIQKWTQLAALPKASKPYGSGHISEDTPKN